MPRLRVTAGLSLLALLVAVPGTAWLSRQSDIWSGPRHAVVRVHTAPPARDPGRALHRRQPPPRVVGALSPGFAAEIARADTTTVPPTLVPVSMPPLADRYDAVQGHLDGELRLTVTADGGGRVLALAVARSSGDPVLDDYAARLVSGWRFAVPASRPARFSGELPMRFGTSGPTARSP